MPKYCVLLTVDHTVDYSVLLTIFIVVRVLLVILGGVAVVQCFRSRCISLSIYVNEPCIPSWDARCVRVCSMCGKLFKRPSQLQLANCLIGSQELLSHRNNK